MKTIFFEEGAGEEAYPYCAGIIQKGGLVAFPTETVYGLGASALDGKAVSDIFKAKGRPGDNPLIVHVAYPEDAEAVAVTSEVYYELAERFMPGPLTVILPRKDVVPDEVTAGLDSVGIRCPSHPAAHAFILACGVPIAAPSANVSGAPSPTTAHHVMNDMDGKIDAVIDGGECDFGLESTVIKLDGRKCVILRPGAVTRDELLEVLDEVSVSEAVKDPSAAGDHPASPGMKYRHYAPSCEFVLVECDDDRFREAVNSEKGKIGVICSEEEKDLFCGAVTYVYGHEGDVKELCHSLFSFFRYAGDDGVEKLFARLPDDKGQSLALYNRMIRAAGNRITRL